jgi:hypothetical protein
MHPPAHPHPTHPTAPPPPVGRGAAGRVVGHPGGQPRRAGRQDRPGDERHAAAAAAQPLRVGRRRGAAPPAGRRRRRRRRRAAAGQRREAAAAGGGAGRRRRQPEEVQGARRPGAGGRSWGPRGGGGFRRAGGAVRRGGRPAPACSRARAGTPWLTRIPLSLLAPPRPAPPPAVHQCRGPRGVCGHLARRGDGRPQGAGPARGVCAGGRRGPAGGA